MYTVDYFISLFTRIPYKKWCTDEQFDNYGNRCAYGHCRVEGKSIEDAFHNFDLKWGCKLKLTFIAKGKCQQETVLADVNNGYYKEYQQPTPKERILAALYDIKAMQEKEQKPERVKTVYVSVPETIKEQTTELILS